MTPLQIKLLFYGLLTSIIVGVGYLAYDSVYDRGYAAAEQKFNEQQNRKVEEVTATVVSLISATTNYNVALMTDIARIQSTLNGKLLVEYRDGKCQLTQDYRSARSEAIERANKR